MSLLHDRTHRPRPHTGALSAAIALGTGLLASALWVSGCGQQEAADSGTTAASTAPQPGGASAQSSAVGGPIVLISIDTLRSDRLPAYGYTAGRTPALDRVRADGILFDRAYSPIPLTTPAHASMLTGHLPPRHGIRDNAGYKLESDGAPTLATLLQASGYRTLGAVSSFTMRTATGLGRGFEHYDDRFEIGTRQGIGQVQRAGADTLAALLTPLRDAAEAQAPFFAFLHLYEPHAPYAPPPAFADLADSYDGEIAAADAVVGELLDTLDDLGVYEQTTIVITADHGEGLGDHGEAEHGVLLYREALQVPLIVKLPGARHAGQAVATPVALTDLAATLLAVAGHDQTFDSDGRSLLPMIEQQAAGERPSEGISIGRGGLYAESYHPQLRYGWSGLTSWIEGGWHLIDGPDPELYDLNADPGETRNLLTEQRRVYARMRDALAAVATEPATPGVIDEETRRRLESLGYLGSSQKGGENLPDPKTQLQTLGPLRRGIDALSRGERARAITLLRETLEANPRFEAAWSHLGLAYEESDQPEQAMDAYREAFDLSPGAPEVIDALVRVGMRLGLVDEVATFLPLAVENHPEDLDLHFLTTRTLLVQRKFDDALAAAKATVALAPDHPDARYQLGASHMALRQLDQAEAHLLSAIEAAQGAYPPALQDLSVLYLSQGRKGEASRLLERLLQIQPENPFAAEQLRKLREGG